MRDKGFGRIIFISSESGVQIPTEMIHYGFTPTLLGSERVPGWTLREFEIAEIGAEAEPDARADRHDHDIVRYKRRHPQAADQISRAGHAAEPLENSLGSRQVVNQHHGARAVGAVIETERWPLPVHARVARILIIKLPVAKTRAADKGAARFFAENIAVRKPPLAHHCLDDQG